MSLKSNDSQYKPASPSRLGYTGAGTIVTTLHTNCENNTRDSITRSLDLEPEQDELFPGERKARPGIDASQRIPGKREVDLYVRTYTTLLQSSGAVPVSSLIPAHLTAASSLHAGAAEPDPDLNAFMYSAQRLPDCIVNVTDIVLGQSARWLPAGRIFRYWRPGRSYQRHGTPAALAV